MKNKPKRKTKEPEYGAEEGARIRDIIDTVADEIGDGEMLVADGFDAAIIGYTDDSEPKVVYDWNECVNILINRDGMSHDIAVEHMGFNVTGAYVGERTPLFVRTIK